ncbi:MAG: phasin family protein [Betaproteobacteria bacterium]|jgi:phasin family protein|nr:phasin family protein [Betaproteobacteria bacterium]
MIKINDQFAAANKAAIDSLMTFANTSLATAERLAALNLNTARAFIADSAANSGALLAVKDVQGFIALQTTLAKPSIEKAVAYSRSVYEILNESSNGLTQVVEGQTAEIKKNFSAAIEQSLKNAPAGSESVVVAVKSAMAQADSAYEKMTQSAKQAKATIEANVAAANAATVKLINKAA